MSTIAICVGHSRKVNGRPEGGAVSHDGRSNEWIYNLPLAGEIAALIAGKVDKVEIISEYQGGGYGSAQRWLAKHLKSLGATLAVELHFNSASSDGTGHEWLYWHNSSNGKKLATSLHLNMCLVLPQIKSRGIKPKFSGDRGSEFLSGTHCPAIIAEPFFGSHPADWATAQSHRSDIARAIAEGILDYLD